MGWRKPARVKGKWRIFDKRYDTGKLFTDHLTFAMRHENIDLLLLKRASGLSGFSHLRAEKEAANFKAREAVGCVAECV